MPATSALIGSGHAGDGCNVHDGSSTRSLNLIDRVETRVVGTLEEEVYEVVPCLSWSAAEVAGARRVNENLDPRELLDGRGDCLRHRLLIGSVDTGEGSGPTLEIDCVHYLVTLNLVNVGKHHLRSGLRADLR